MIIPKRSSAGASAWQNFLPLLIPRPDCPVLNHIYSKSLVQCTSLCVLRGGKPLKCRQPSLQSAIRLVVSVLLSTWKNFNLAMHAVLFCRQRTHVIYVLRTCGRCVFAMQSTEISAALLKDYQCDSCSMVYCNTYTKKSFNRYENSDASWLLITCLLFRDIVGTLHLNALSTTHIGRRLRNLPEATPLRLVNIR